MFLQFRLDIGRFLLDKDTARVTRKRMKKVHNLHDAHSIGLLYNATERETFWTVRTFVNDLKGMNKRVIALGYQDEHPKKHLKQLLEYRYFTKRDVNWYFKPRGMEVEHFITEDFDILINLCLDDLVPIHYICGLSQAKFKVGEGDGDKQMYCDMVINVGGRKTLDFFISQIKHYLSILNRPVQK